MRYPPGSYLHELKCWQMQGLLTTVQQQLISLARSCQCDEETEMSSNCQVLINLMGWTEAKLQEIATHCPYIISANPASEPPPVPTWGEWPHELGKRSADQFLGTPRNQPGQPGKNAKAGAKTILEKYLHMYARLENEWDNVKQAFVTTTARQQLLHRDDRRRAKRFAPFIIPAVVGGVAALSATAGVAMSVINSNTLTHMKEQDDNRREAQEFVIQKIQTNYERTQQLDQELHVIKHQANWLINQTTELIERAQLNDFDNQLRNVFDLIEHEVKARAHGYVALLHGQFSPMLINASAMTSASRAIQAATDARGYSFPVNDLAFLYQLPATYLMEDDGQVTAFLNVPLINKNAVWDLYRLVTIPIALPGSMHSMSLEPEADYLAILSSKDGFMYLTSQQLQECHQAPDMHICPNMAYEYRVPEDYCITSLFKLKHSAISQVCRTALAPAKVQVEQVSTTDFMVFHPREEGLVMTCPHENRAITPWRGAKLVTVPEDCVGDGVGYQLSPTASLTVNLTVITIQSVWRIKELTHNIPLPALDVMVPTPPERYVDTDDLVTQYWQIAKKTPALTWDQSLFSSFFIALGVLATIVCIFLCFRAWCCGKVKGALGVDQQQQPIVTYQRGMDNISMGSVPRQRRHSVGGGSSIIHNAYGALRSTASFIRRSIQDHLNHRSAPAEREMEEQLLNSNVPQRPIVRQPETSGSAANIVR